MERAKEIDRDAVVMALGRYDRELRERHGVRLAELRAESGLAWDFLLGCAERGVEPRAMARRLAAAYGLVEAGTPFARTLEEARLFNRHRLALAAYAEERGLGWDFRRQGPLEDVAGMPMMWTVMAVRDGGGRIVGARFCVQETATGRLHAGCDIEAAREAALIVHAAEPEAAPRPR